MKFIKWTLVGIVALVVASFLFGKPPEQNDTSQAKDTSNETQNPNITDKPFPTLTKEEKTEMAMRYCEKRENRSSTLYPAPGDIEGEGENEDFDIPEERKTGNNLTSSDCENIIDFLSKLNAHLNPLSSIDIERVIDAKAWIGMNLFELYFSYGNPDKINKSNYGSGVRQQWVYDYGSAGTTYFYLEGDLLPVVTSYQDY